MKILYVTTVVSTMDFFVEHIKMLQELGHCVEMATNINMQISNDVRKLNCKIHNIGFSRNPFSLDNIKSLKQFSNLIETGSYDIIHTHTPNASTIVRLVCKKWRKFGLRVIYTSHGFHFYKGAPIKNWLLYYPVEWICAHWTDVLITINKEDYFLAKRKMNTKTIKYIPGIGINLENIKKIAVDKKEKRKELGLSNKDIVFLSVGELNENKNHISVIKALGELKKEREIKYIKYLICGQGNKKLDLINAIEEYDLKDSVKLLGFRQDVLEIYQIIDFFVFPSFREGLSVSMMEAMANGVPIICSKIRGNEDLVDEKGGMLFNPYDIKNIKDTIFNMIGLDVVKLDDMKIHNIEKVKQFSNKYVLNILKKIYEV